MPLPGDRKGQTHMAECVSECVWHDSLPLTLAFQHDFQPRLKSSQEFWMRKQTRGRKPNCLQHRISCFFHSYCHCVNALNRSVHVIILSQGWARGTQRGGEFQAEHTAAYPELLPASFSTKHAKPSAEVWIYLKRDIQLAPWMTINNNHGTFKLLFALSFFSLTFIEITSNSRVIPLTIYFLYSVYGFKHNASSLHYCIWICFSLVHSFLNKFSLCQQHSII